MQLQKNSENDAFYNALQHALDTIPKVDLKIINAEVDTKSSADVGTIGKKCWQTNGTWDRLVDFRAITIVYRIVV